MKIFTFLPKSWEGRDGASPVHGEKKKPGCRLTDIMYVQILWHGARHRQLHRNRKAGENYFQLRVKFAYWGFASSPTLKPTWLSVSSGPSTSMMGVSWSRPIRWIVVPPTHCKDLLVSLCSTPSSDGLKTLDRVSKALDTKNTNTKINPLDRNRQHYFISK